MKSKYIFKQHGKQLDKETKEFKAYSEKTDIPLKGCNHKGKVRLENGELRCTCGAGWSGGNIEKLFDLLNKK